MSQRALLTVGVVAIAASFVVGALAVATGAVGAPMMGGVNSSNARSISIEEAQHAVQSYLDRTGNSDLRIDELKEFDRNFYASIKERSTGVGAFEVLVNKGNAAVSPEPGPNMMWNTKCSMMGGGPFRIGTAGGSMNVSADQAKQIAQNWLDQHLSGDSASSPDVFYGYYTVDFAKNGQIAGMLSVNGYSGQVWYHSWHGSFTQLRDFGA